MGNIQSIMNKIFIVMLGLMLLRFSARAKVRGDLEDMMIEMVQDMRETNMKVEHLEQDMMLKDTMIRKLERDVSYHTFFCAYQYETDRVSQKISYERLVDSSTYVDGADMDIVTGVFTSGLGGMFTVTWSVLSRNEPEDQDMFIYLRKNGAIITESRLHSLYRGASGWTDENGGRTLVLNLDRGDTLDLWCEDCSAGVYDITFCITQSSFDMNLALIWT